MNLYNNRRLVDSWKFSNNFYEASLSSCSLHDPRVIITHKLSVDSFFGCKMFFLICHLISSIGLNWHGYPSTCAHHLACFVG